MGDIRRAAALYREATADPMSALAQLRRGVADADDLVRHVAAVQLAFHHPGELPESATRELLTTLLREWDSDPSPLTPEYTEATYDGEDCWYLGQHIALALANLPAGSAEFAVAKLVALWQRHRQFYEAALAAVALAFPVAACPAATAMSGSQWVVLQALAADDAIWTYCGDTSPLLVARGLPGSRRGIEAFLAGTGE